MLSLSLFCLPCGRICHSSNHPTGPFSADHAPGDSILTLRPLWPSREAHQSATDAVVKTGSFFTQDHVDGARILLRTPSLHFEKLDLLFRLLCPGDKPCAPLDSSITLADGLGCFSHVVFLHDRLLQLLSHEPHRQAHNGDGRGGGGGSFDETNGNGGLNGHSEDAKDKDQNGKGRGGPVYGGTGIAQVANLNPSAVTPSRRTPTEKVMVDFLATLMACIAGQIQPFSRTPVCFADAFELTFRFGPISGRSQDGEAEAGNELSKQPAFFCARIDGGIPFAWIQDEGREFFAVFKVKESQRSEDDVEARAQHTMEHAAVIWERHEGYQVCLSPCFRVWNGSSLSLLWGGRAKGGTRMGDWEGCVSSDDTNTSGSFFVLVGKRAFRDQGVLPQPHVFAGWEANLHRH